MCNVWSEDERKHFQARALSWQRINKLEVGSVCTIVTMLLKVEIFITELAYSNEAVPGVSSCWCPPLTWHACAVNPTLKVKEHIIPLHRDDFCCILDDRRRGPSLVSLSISAEIHKIIESAVCGLVSMLRGTDKELRPRPGR